MTVAPAAFERDANLLLISIDTLRADHLAPYGYAEIETPAISQLATEGVRFSAAYTPVPLTLPAHASMLTALLPPRHAVRDNGGIELGTSHRTLAETLQQTGYATAGFVSSFVLDSRWGLARGFDHYFDDFPVSAVDLGAMASIQRPGHETWQQARAWLDRAGDRKFFAWIHLFDPHTPYAPPGPFQERYATRPYDGEIAYVDSVLGQMLAYLESRSLLERTIIVLVGDHGEGLGEHDEDEHGLLAYDSTLHVPWIVRLPNRRLAGRVVDEAVSLVDVFPTLARLLGVTTPTDIDGLDRTALLETLVGNTDVLYAETFYPRLRMGWSELTSVRSGDYKYIRAPVPELYNYRADPREQKNLAAHNSEVVARLDRILTRARGEQSTTPLTSNTPDPQTVRQLQALGYVAGTVAPIDLSKALADPKTKTGPFRDIMRARQQLAEGSEQEGLRTLQSLILGDPDLEIARRTLREYWTGRQRFDVATRWFKSALARHSGHAGLWRDLATIARSAGNFAEAKQAIGRALAIRPDDADNLVVAGELDRDAGRLDAALSSFNRATKHSANAVVPQMHAVETLIRMGRLSEAESILRAVLTSDPNAASGHYLLAQIAEARKDFRLAESEYRLEIERNPWEYRARFNLALLLGARNAHREQLAMLESIPPLAPQFGDVHFYIAKALLDLGERSRLEDAARAARLGLELAPNAPSAPLGHYVLADVYQLLNRQADAARELQRGRELERRLNMRR